MFTIALFCISNCAMPVCPAWPVTISGVQLSPSIMLISACAFNKLLSTEIWLWRADMCNAFLQILLLEFISRLCSISKFTISWYPCFAGATSAVFPSWSLTFASSSSNNCVFSLSSVIVLLYGVVGFSENVLLCLHIHLIHCEKPISPLETKCPPFRRRHFQMHFVNETICISIRISPKFIPKGPHWFRSRLGTKQGINTSGPFY